MGFLSSQAAQLGQVLYEQGRLEEAEEMAEVAERSGASDDLSTQVPRRGVKAKVLARRGDLAAALALAEEAVAVTEGSDFVESRMEALWDLADVHRIAESADEAARALNEALDLVERKGVLPMIDRIRSRLDEVGGS